MTRQPVDRLPSPTAGRRVARTAPRPVVRSHSSRAPRVLGAIVALAVAFTAPARAQSPAAPPAHDSTAAPARRAVAVSPASPRASVRRYLELARAGRFDDAAAYLDVPDSLAAAGPRLARELKAVLDRHAWIDLEQLSPAAAGDTADGLRTGVDEIATIPSPTGGSQPVRIARATRDQEDYWRFTRATVLRLPAWYDALDDRWVLEHLPAPLLRRGPFEILYWQWLMLPVLFVVAVGIGAVASRIARAGAGRAARRTRAEWDNAVLERVGGPLAAGFALIAARALLPLLSLDVPAAQGLARLIRAAGLLVVFWVLWRLVDVARTVLAQSRWARSAPSSRSLLPLGSRVTKIAILAIATVATLSLLGYPVASLLAGLGIGGLAVALAAQKTVENLFGAFSIGVDQPFREGDFVKVQDFVGTVEDIGLRSTRFRTLDRTIITIPNGALADMKLESFAVRDRLRLAAVVGLVYETTAAQMREVLAGLEAVLRAQAKIWPDAVVVRFSELAPSSLNIEVMAWFQTSDWGEFQLIRQDVLLQFMEVVERAGTSFAFPTQTLHVASVPDALLHARGTAFPAVPAPPALPAPAAPERGGAS